MTLLFVGFIALALLAVSFVVWPMFSKAQARPLGEADHVQENVRSYQEYVNGLQEQLTAERITLEEFEALKLEKARALLNDEATVLRQKTLHTGHKAVLLIAAVSVLAASAALYSRMGASDDVELRHLMDLKREQLMADFSQNRTPDPAMTRALIEKLQTKLERDPSNSQYWFLLARNHVELNQFAEAVRAYEKIIARDESSALVFSEAAQALFLQQQQTLSEKVVSYVDKALALDANNAVALGLSGIIGFSNKDYARAVDAWTRVLAQSGPNSPSAPQILAGIEQAKQLLAASGGAVAANEIIIPVKVSLSEKVVPPKDAVLLVYARAWQGSKMPLAITKFPLSELPERVELSEAMAMSPAATLASAAQVEIVVRVSATGEAMPQPGDWEGSAGPFNPRELPDVVTVEVNTPL